ncbi:MAG: hypothetical protein AB1555_12875 [Nitrospirota bacterium]
MSLQLARANLSHLNGTPLTEDLDAVIAKVAASLPAKTANPLERIVRVFAPVHRGTRSYAGKNDLLRQLRTALLLQLTVKLSSKKPDTIQRYQERSLKLFLSCRTVAGCNEG